MRRVLGVAVLAVAGLGLVWAGGQQGGGAQPAANDEAGLRAAIEAYAKTLKTGDLKAIMNYWAPDADFTSETGEVIKGREAISKLYVENLADLKAGKSVIKIDSLRFLTPEVAALDGAVEFTPPDGPTESNRFGAVWTRKDGRWIIASARDLPEAEGQAADRGRKEMQWLTGEWTAKDRDTTINLNVRPELDGKFALARFEIKGPKQTLLVYQLLGWDPIEGALRSWMFDSNGGFGETLWVRDGATWTGNTAGVLPTGQTGSSVNTLQMMGPDQFKWRVTSREVDGQPIPDSDITYNRVAPKR
jgi:uncharacterized protein (TIGR02246 family)